MEKQCEHPPGNGGWEQAGLFAALAHDRPMVNNQIKIVEKSNEIPAMPEKAVSNLRAQILPLPQAPLDALSQKLPAL